MSLADEMLRRRLRSLADDARGVPPVRTGGTAATRQAEMLISNRNLLPMQVQPNGDQTGAAALRSPALRSLQTTRGSFLFVPGYSAAPGSPESLPAFGRFGGDTLAGSSGLLAGTGVATGAMTLRVFLAAAAIGAAAAAAVGVQQIRGAGAAVGVARSSAIAGNVPYVAPIAVARGAGLARALGSALVWRSGAAIGVAAAAASGSSSSSPGGHAAGVGKATAAITVRVWRTGAAVGVAKADAAAATPASLSGRAIGIGLAVARARTISPVPIG